MSALEISEPYLRVSRRRAVRNFSKVGWRHLLYERPTASTTASQTGSWAKRPDGPLWEKLESGRVFSIVGR